MASGRTVRRSRRRDGLPGRPSRERDGFPGRPVRRSHRNSHLRLIYLIGGPTLPPLAIYHSIIWATILRAITWIGYHLWNPCAVGTWHWVLHVLLGLVTAGSAIRIIQSVIGALIVVGLRLRKRAERLPRLQQYDNMP